MQRDTSSLHRVDQAVHLGLWNVVPLIFNGCAKLLDIGGNWNFVVHIDPEHPTHAQLVTCLVSMAMEELGQLQPPGIMYRSLRHGAVHYHAKTW